MKLNTNNSNSQQALWVAIGSMSSFAVSIITSMILSRYFIKEDYGTYKQVMYVYQTLLTIFTLGLPQAFGYFLPRVTIEEGKDVVNKITSIFFLMGFFFSITLYSASGFISDVMNNPNLKEAIQIFSPVPFLLLPTLGLQSIYSSYRKSYIASIYTVSTRTLSILLIVLPVIIFHGSYKMALVGFSISSLFSFIIALYLKNYPFKSVVSKKSNVTISQLLKFSFPLMYAGIWGLIINSSDQFFISRYFGTKTFAEFSNGSMELPFVGMIIGACTTVLYPLFSKMNNENLDPRTSIFPVWQSVFKKTAMLIYPLVVFCWIYSKEIMIVMYGSEYALSGIYFKIKLLANLFTLIAFAPVILSIGKTKYYANVHMYSAIFLVIAEYLCVLLFPNPVFISAISTLFHIGRIFAMLALISKYFNISILKLFPISLMAKILLPSVIFLFILRSFITSSFSSVSALLIAGSVYIILYTIYSYLIKLDYVGLIKPMFKK